MATVTRIAGGLKREMQFTPDVCRAVIAVVGILPGMTAESVLADIEDVLAAERAKDPALQTEARLYPGGLFVSGTLEQDASAAPTASLRRAYARILASRQPSTARTPTTTRSVLRSVGSRRLPSVPARTVGRRSMNTFTFRRLSPRQKFWRSPFLISWASRHEPAAKALRAP